MSKDEANIQSNEQASSSTSSGGGNSNSISETDKLQIAGKRALLAAEKGRLFELVKLVHRFPQVVNFKDADGYTPLHRAAYSDNLDCVKFLVRKEAKINALTNDSWTPLHCAAKWNNVKIVEFLIANGANVNAKSSNNNTPLHLASANGRYLDTCDIIQMLLYHPDCDFKAINDSKDTAYDIAKRSGPFSKLWSGVMTLFPDKMDPDLTKDD